MSFVVLGAVAFLLLESLLLLAALTGVYLCRKSSDSHLATRYDRDLVRMIPITAIFLCVLGALIGMHAADIISDWPLPVAVISWFLFKPTLFKSLLRDG